MVLLKNISVSIGGKKILDDVSLEIKPRQLCVLMGPNGSGKSTLATEILKRSKMDGKVFLGFQQPVTVPGVNYNNFLRLAYNHKLSLRGAQNATKQSSNSTKKIAALPSVARNDTIGPLEFYKYLKEKAKILEIPEEFLSRNLNENFSGGEKKKMELLQALVLEPDYAILDEPDSGIDSHGLSLVAKGIKYLVKNRSGVLLITHNQNLLKLLTVSKIYRLEDGHASN